MGDDKDNDFHGVFVAFAPYDDPEIALLLLLNMGTAVVLRQGKFA